MIEYKSFKDGKRHICTFSYDDCPPEDYKLVEIFNKHGMKATFNLNSCHFTEEYGVNGEDVAELYKGHEVAVHTLKHPWIEKCSNITLINQVLEDRKNIEKQCGYVVRGMAYPYGTYDEDSINILKSCGIVYSRTAGETHGFTFPVDFMKWTGTCHHKNCESEINRFISALDSPWASNLLYIWGHSFEFSNSPDRGFDFMDKMCAQLAEHKDKIWFSTNIEIYDYIMAQKALQVAADESFVYNPTQIDVWVVKDGKDYKIPAGEKVVFQKDNFKGGGFATAFKCKIVYRLNNDLTVFKTIFARLFRYAQKISET